jgi:hypothetical protein
MGLLAADLKRLRSKTASEAPPKPVRQIENLRDELERYAGAEHSLQKEASAQDHERLFVLHGNVETTYREAVKIGKRKEANVLLDKFAGWTYLKGSPGVPGDMTPFPVPDEK